MLTDPIPGGWQIKKLADISTTVMGQSPPGITVIGWKSSESSDRPGLPFIQGNAEFSAKSPIPTKWCLTPLKVAEPGDTLISVRAPVGALNHADQRIAIGRGLAALRFEKVDPRFGWHLISMVVSDLARVAQGSTFEAINAGDLQNLIVAVPPKEEQLRIADVLDAIDLAIEKTASVIGATERLRQALAHDFLTRGVPGWHHEWKQVLGIGTLPSCWRVARLDDVAQVQTGRAVGKPVNHGQHLTIMPYLSVANVKDGYLDLSSVKTMRVTSEEVRRFSLKPGDVLFTEGGDADKLGRGCVWGGEIDPCLHQNHVFAVRPEVGVLRPRFLALFARSEAGKAYFLKCSKQTTNLASINSSQLKEFRLPVPPLEEQDAILAVLSSVSPPDPIAQVLRRLKAALGDELLNGRVRVPEQEPRLAGTASS